MDICPQAVYTVKVPEKYNGWVSKLEAAERLGLSTKSIDRAIRIGKLRAGERVMVGRRPLIVVNPQDVAKIETERLKKKLVAAKLDLQKMFVTLKEATALTGLTESTLQGFMVSGKLPFLELEEGLRLRRRDLDAL